MLAQFSSLKVGKGGLPPLLEWHSISAGVNHLPDHEVLFKLSLFKVECGQIVSHWSLQFLSPNQLGICFSSESPAFLNLSIKS